MAVHAEPEVTSRSGRKIKPKRYLHEEIEETVVSPKRQKMSTDSAASATPITASAPLPVTPMAATSSKADKTNDIISGKPMDKSTAADKPAEPVKAAAVAAAITATATSSLPPPVPVQFTKVPVKRINALLGLPDRSTDANSPIEPTEFTDSIVDNCDDTVECDNPMHKEIIANFKKMDYLYKDNLLLALLSNDRVCGIKCDAKNIDDLKTLIGDDDHGKWNTEKAHKLMEIKKDLESGKIPFAGLETDDRFVLDPELSEMQLTELRMEKRMAEKLHLNRLLGMERQLVDIDHKIKSSLQLSSADPVTSLDLLKKYKGMCCL